VIFYGTSNTTKECGEVSMACTHCGSLTSSVTKVFNYFYLYWVPIIPLTTQVATSCTNCKHFLYGKDIPEASRKKAVEATKDHKRPFYHYIGAIIIACLIAFGVSSSQKSDKERAIFVSSPKVGDVYVIKVDDYLQQNTEEKHPDELDYTLMELQQIQDGIAVFSLANSTFSSPRSGLKFFDKGQVKFGHYKLELKVDDLPNLNENGKIRDIVRKQ